VKPVRIYTTRACGYCARAKALLGDAGIPFQEIDVEGDDVARAALVQETGQRTVPQIFVGDRPIGGYRELLALARSGSLAALLAE
jgi:glutaredoxin 3